VTRYLYAYGPATPQHFARWLGIPSRYAIELFGTLAGELQRVELDGEPGWILAGDTATPSRPHRGVLTAFGPQRRRSLWYGSGGADASWAR
jgi:Winged helix DNA-binding domain